MKVEQQIRCALYCRSKALLWARLVSVLILASRRKHCFEHDQNPSIRTIFNAQHDSCERESRAQHALSSDFPFCEPYAVFVGKGARPLARAPSSASSTNPIFQRWVFRGRRSGARRASEGDAAETAIAIVRSGGTLELVCTHRRDCLLVVRWGVLREKGFKGVFGRNTRGDFGGEGGERGSSDGGVRGSNKRRYYLPG